MHTRILLFIAFNLSLFSCKVSEKATIEHENVALDIDTIQQVAEILPEVKLYRAEATRHFQLKHTKLEVSFDWDNQYLHGIATLILEPFFYDQSELILDAKGFEIHKVKLLASQDSIPLNYSYNGKSINITLDKIYQKGQPLHVQIVYTAKPNEGEFADNPASDQKGLYFINPRNEITGKPRQIWTQGETDNNSRWFPTIDHPNQKSTQEMFITVDEQFKTLSNGILVYSKSNENGTRTDYWKMDKPHAPYLFMLAVGEFEITEDEWQGIKVDYYMEPKFGKYARDIFGHTPEMISFFSDTLNYPFPWPKYSQVVVRDFVSGAMENTSASVFMEELNVNRRELIDYEWDDIIAHELFHQWFGDLVTCESWANLPLNESFATYSEYLWRSHKYGKDEGDYHLYDELQTYLIEAKNKKVDLIRFDFENSDDMFDSHSYAKGGLILHALRSYIGDEAFFTSLELYLKSNEYGKAEVHELRLAFEQVIGEDLNWFFNQWFLSAGHPILYVEDAYDSVANKYIVSVWQQQDISLYPIYKLPITLDIWQHGTKERYIVEIDKPYQEFEFENVEKPDLMMFDSDFLLVGEIDHDKSDRQYQYQFEYYPENVRARIEALDHAIENPQNDITKHVLEQALDDPFWVIRKQALEFYEEDTTGLFAEVAQKVVKIATNDPDAVTKATAISLLETQDNLEYGEVFKSNLYDSSYSVAGQALYGYLQSDDEEKGKVVETFINELNFNITSSLADYFIVNEDYSKFPWFVDKIKHYNSEELWYFIRIFASYLINAPEEQIESGIGQLKEIALHHHQFYNRFAAYQSIEMFMDKEGIPAILEEIKVKEEDPRVRQYFE